MAKYNTSPDTITIELTQDYVTIIDAVDADLADLRWHVSHTRQNTPHAVRNIRKSNGKYTTEYLHRVILARMVGRPLKRHEHTDHIDGDGLDNRRANLRLATNAQNARNSRVRANNTSGYKGVSWHKASLKWHAQITVDRKQIHLGLFPTPEDAHDAYCKASEKYHGEFGRTE